VGLREAKSPVPAEALRPGVIVLDAVYDPERTRLLEDTLARGGRAIGGKWMLVYQAIEQLRLWTRALPEPPSPSELEDAVPVMAEAFDRAAENLD
jgi:shikimate dehydrogenase